MDGKCLPAKILPVGMGVSLCAVVGQSVTCLCGHVRHNFPFSIYLIKDTISLLYTYVCVYRRHTCK